MMTVCRNLLSSPLCGARLKIVHFSRLFSVRSAATMNASIVLQALMHTMIVTLVVAMNVAGRSEFDKRITLGDGSDNGGSDGGGGNQVIVASNVAKAIGKVYFKPSFPGVNETAGRVGRSHRVQYAFPHYDSHRSKNQYPFREPNYSRRKESSHHGIHVANWRWDEIGLFFTFTAFVVVTGLAKVGFHHAHWLSSWVPESCLMIIMGVILGTILYLSGVPEPENEADKVVPDGEFALPTFTPRLFFLILLPPYFFVLDAMKPLRRLVFICRVILESAYSLYDRSFADNLSTILVYAVLGTLINTFLIGPLLYGLSVGGLMGMISLTMTDTIVFAALISAVDPVAVLAIFQEVGVNKDLYYLLFGESLLNDAVTVVLYTTTVTFTEMKNIDGSQFGLAIIAFFTVSLGGLIIGIFFGLLTALITKTTKDIRVVEPLAVLGISYLSYLSAELFHFSGIISIIGCGVVQAHYALKNISAKSRTTVTYFTKMISSTSDAIIFLFLGMVLVSKRHVWHTGFVLWTLLLCFLCRFIGVFCLSAVVNLYRVRKINFQEQFIMAYGGLRGAVAFSLVTMLDDEVVKSQPVFLTTTLIVILFTVFIQGGTIKWLVKLLRIKKSSGEEKTMNEEINDNIISTMMAGIEEISGVRGDYYVRRKIQYIDEHYLKKIFLNTTKSNSLTRLYEKLALTQHIAHLYGPVVLIEDKKTDLLHVDPRKRLMRSMSARQNSAFPGKLPELFSGVQLRRRTMSDFNRPSPAQIERNSLKLSTEQLRKAFRESAYNKLRDKFDPISINDLDEQEMLRRRQETAQRITYQAALSLRRVSGLEDDIKDDPSSRSRKFISEADEIDPETLEGIDVILERARKRLARHNSSVETTLSKKDLEAMANSGATSPLLTPTRTSALYTLSKNMERARKNFRFIGEQDENEASQVLPNYMPPSRHMSCPSTGFLKLKQEEKEEEEEKESKHGLGVTTTTSTTNTVTQSFNVSKPSMKNVNDTQL